MSLRNIRGIAAAEKYTIRRKAAAENPIRGVAAAENTL